MITSEEFLEEIYETVDRKINRAVSERLGTVVGFFPDGQAKIRFDTELETSIKKYKRFGNYTPKLNDRVVIVKILGVDVIYSDITGGES